MSLAIAGIAMAGVGIAKGISGFISSRKAKKEEKEQKDKLAKRMEAMEGLDTSNPYADAKNQYENMENTMEDLTINQKAAEFQRQSFQQSQANILSGLRGAAGSSGIAALAQSLAQQGQISSQRAAADIGAQEAQNEKLERQQAAQLQQM